PDGGRLAYTALDGSVSFFDGQGRPIRAPPQGAAGARTRWFAYGGDTLAVLWTDFRVSFHDAATAALRFDFSVTPNPLLRVAVSPRGDSLAVWDPRGPVLRLHPTAAEGAPRTLPAPADPVTALGFRNDGAVLAAGCRNGSVVLLDVASGRAVRILGGHPGQVTAVGFSPHRPPPPRARQDKKHQGVGPPPRRPPATRAP